MNDLASINMQGTRDPIVYECEGLKLFGVIHRPLSMLGRRPGVVMYHGFVGAKYQPPHRIFVRLAEALAQVGIASLRVDLPGRGDSEGNSIDITVAGDLKAARGGIDALADQPGIDSENIGLLGISWGGILAATLAGRDSRVTGVSLWSCAPGEAPNWQPDLRNHGEAKVTEVFGNLIGENFYVGLHVLNPLEDLKRAHIPVLLVYGTEDEETPVTGVERAKTQLSAVGIPVQILAVHGADHIFSTTIGSNACLTIRLPGSNKRFFGKRLKPRAPPLLLSWVTSSTYDFWQGL